MDAMMQPGRWNNGVGQPSYAGPLMNFQPMADFGKTVARQMQPRPPQPQGPLQLTPGPGQGVPQNVQPTTTGVGGGMNAMASTVNGVPLAAALMRMLGGPNSGRPEFPGVMRQPASPPFVPPAPGYSTGNPGGVAGNLPPIY